MSGLDLFGRPKHQGILADEQKAEAIPKGKRCARCDGTGNELYSMYRRCSDCAGTGRAHRACCDCGDAFEPKREKQIRCAPCQVVKDFG